MESQRSRTNLIQRGGGTFVTQQVDYHDNDDLAQILGIETPEEPDSWIGLAERQVTEAGLVIEGAARADQRIRCGVETATEI